MMLDFPRVLDDLNYYDYYDSMIFPYFFAEPGDFPAMITTLNQLATEEGGLAPQYRID
jgi:hypothetical protein